MALEQLTNPRVRDEVGEIALVPPDERIAGPGASYVMASFTHLNPGGSRFSDGSFGVYYAASDLDTAIAETVYHFERLARDSNDPPRREDMRVLVGAIDQSLENVSALVAAERRAILDLPICTMPRERTVAVCGKPAPWASSIPACAAAAGGASRCSERAPSGCLARSVT